MVMQIILWTLLIVLVSIIPLMVATYWNKLKYKRNEITSLLAGNVGVKYLEAYYPETLDEQKVTREDNKLLAKKLEEIISRFFENEYNPLKFIIPLTTIIIITCAMLFMFLATYFQIVSLSERETKFLQSIPFLIYLGFMGAFIASLQEMYKRYNNMDLTPCFLYSINAKILLCSILAYIWSAVFTDDIAIFVSFGVGFLPISVIKKQISKMTVLRLGEKTQPSLTSELSKLQGLGTPIIDRLEDEDIHNCQSLAYSDPIKILFKTHYQLKIILDWIDQALLYNYVGDHIKALRQMGIRGIIEFCVLYESTDLFEGGTDNLELLDSLSTKINSSPAILKNFLDSVYNDPHIQLIWYLFSESSGADE